jgi:CobQ-like glutamine amidotransferase family enzyme
LYGNNSECTFLKCERGIGINPNSTLEGMRKNNLFCTQLLGPILPLNPLFTEHLFRLCGSGAQAAYRETAVAAYEQRLAEFQTAKSSH